MSKNRILTLTDWEVFAQQISLADSNNIDIIRQRGSDVRIVRAKAPNDQPVVIKLWNRHGWKSWIRRLTMTSPASREWRGLKNMRTAGLDSPEPLACLIGIQDAAHTEAVIMEDLGRCPNAVDHLKGLITKGDSVVESKFINDIITITHKMVQNGYLDTDHSLPNIVVTQSGKPIRLDFELISRRPWPKIWYREYGLMIGQLVGSYVFAVQPDTQRVRIFANKLRERLQLPALVLSIARKQVDVFLSTQKNANGIDINIDNLWELD